MAGQPRKHEHSKHEQSKYEQRNYKQSKYGQSRHEANKHNIIKTRVNKANTIKANMDHERAHGQREERGEGSAKGLGTYNNSAHKLVTPARNELHSKYTKRRAHGGRSAPQQVMQSLKGVGPVALKVFQEFKRRQFAGRCTSTGRWWIIRLH
jgi:hypothetical protein